MLSILIADDHELVRRGLKDLLRDEYPEVSFGEAKNSMEILEKLTERRWDLILLDILMPGLTVIEMLFQMRKCDSKVPILILTAVSEAEYALRALEAGANGYITKQRASDELVLAVRTVMKGGTYLSSDAVEVLSTGLRTRGVSASHETLSRRELEVFCSIAKGKAVKEIAFDLAVSAKTVGTYVARIKNKTGLSSYVDIARYALLHKLVD